MPAYNAGETVVRTHEEVVEQECVDEVILVDDCSRDRTVEVARSLGITVIEHMVNACYGANQKTCYREALARGLDQDRVVFLSLHADARHPSLRGVMVYVPGSAYRSRTYGSNSKTYRRYKEVREKPQVRY